jgi:hypothetical protein
VGKSERFIFKPPGGGIPGFRRWLENRSRMNFNQQGKTMNYEKKFTLDNINPDKSLWRMELKKS